MLYYRKWIISVGINSLYKRKSFLSQDGCSHEAASHINTASRVILVFRQSILPESYRCACLLHSRPKLSSLFSLPFSPSKHLWPIHISTSQLPQMQESCYQEEVVVSALRFGTIAEGAKFFCSIGQLSFNWTLLGVTVTLQSLLLNMRILTCLNSHSRRATYPLGLENYPIITVSTLGKWKMTNSLYLLVLITIGLQCLWISLREKAVTWVASLPKSLSRCPFYCCLKLNSNCGCDSLKCQPQGIWIMPSYGSLCSKIVLV